MAGSAGFEPVISSVTGRRDNHYTTGPYLIVNFRYDTSFFILAQRGATFILCDWGAIIICVQLSAAVAQLVERRFRKA